MPRLKTFSNDVALAGAMEVFWKRGYRATSIQNVADHLKLSRSTIYATFGTKASLFVQVLGRYGGTNLTQGLRELCASQTPRVALVKLFEVVGDGNDRQARGVYLLIEAIMLLMHSEPMGLMHSGPEVARIVEEAVREMERRFRDAIERGKATAEIAASVDSAAAAGVLLSLYFGLYVLMRAGADREPVRDAVTRQVQALLSSGDHVTDST